VKNSFIKKISALFAFCLLAFAFESCREDKPCTDNGLPCLTHEGNNTFGCLIDGVPFVAKTSFSIGGAVPVSGSFDESTQYLIIEGSKEDPSEKIETVKIRAYVLSGVGSYSMWVTSSSAQGYTYFNNPNVCTYYHDLDNKGIINISFLDTEKNIISGTFDMTLVNPDCADSTMVITEGRFDFGY
jgi:hypothetical protein